MFDNNTIDRFKNTKTPFYYYDLAVLRATLADIKKHTDPYPHFNVHYAVKANTNAEIMRLISSYGFGADCVSGNEIKRAIETGFKADHIVFAGVGKSDEEIEIALDNEIFGFNCESKQEIEVINEIAKSKNKIAHISLRLNPNVNANTHAYITTGLDENKFGISFWELESVVELVKTLANIKLIGVHFHIGSQIMDMDSYKGLAIRVNEIQKWFVNHNIDLEHINVGGGLGIDYHNPDENPIPNFGDYFKVFNELLELRPNQQLHFELGRSVVAQCGNLISRVVYIKNGAKTDFAILDAGMTELMRPALYQAYHKMENITSTGELQKYDVVGPICESSDCFGKAVPLTPTKRGDLIAIRSAGAYGEVMSSFYNLREKAAAIYSE